MAEKEERIRIEQFEYEGFGHCAGFSTDGEGYYCEFAGESIPINKEFCEKKCPYDNSISRQEAIERMAKAAAKAYRGYFYAEPHHPSISDMMEAALNALLEGK